MKYIEVIQLRTSDTAERFRAVNVCRQIIQSNAAEHPDHISLLQNATLDTDLWVCIGWNKRHSQQKESILGQQIEKGLSDFGLLNHSMWLSEAVLPIPVPEKNKKPEPPFNRERLKGSKPLTKYTKRKNCHVR